MKWKRAEIIGIKPYHVWPIEYVDIKELIKKYPVNDKKS